MAVAKTVVNIEAEVVVKVAVAEEAAEEQKHQQQK